MQRGTPLVVVRPNSIGRETGQLTCEQGTNYHGVPSAERFAPGEVAGQHGALYYCKFPGLFPVLFADEHTGIPLMFTRVKFLHVSYVLTFPNSAPLVFKYVDRKT